MFVFNCAFRLPPGHFLKIFSVFGLGFGLSEGRSLSSGVGGVSKKAAASIFVPSIAIPSRPPRSLWMSQIYRPSVPLSLSLSLSLVPTSPMMRRMHFIMAMLSRRARVRHGGLKHRGAFTTHLGFSGSTRSTSLFSPAPALTGTWPMMNAFRFGMPNSANPRERPLRPRFTF